MWVIVHSPFGKALQAIRDNETRARLRRHPGAALSLDRLRDLRTVHRARRHPVGAAQRADHARHPLLAVLRRDRVHDACSAASATSPARSSARSRSTISRPTRWRAREYWQLLLGVVLVVLVHGAADRHRRHDRAAVRQVHEEARDMALLQTIDLKKYFGETRAVDNVNLTHRGAASSSRWSAPTAPARPRSSTSSARYLRPDSGKIIFKGEDITQRLGDRARQGRHRAQLPARQPVRRPHRVRQRGAGDLLARGQDRATWRRSRISTAR